MIYNFFVMLYQSLVFVATQNGFWGSMGFTVGIAVFIGAMLFDGHVAQSRKSLLMMGSYAFMLIWTTLLRILPGAFEQHFIYSDGKPLAGVVTILYITFFWSLGVVIGVNVFKLKKYRE